MPELLKRLGCRVTAINLETDGRFPRPPEPVPENLKALGALVRRSKADVGIAVDPDVDRLAIVDEKGRPIGEDYTLAFQFGGLGRPGGDVGRFPGLSDFSPVVEDALSTVRRLRAPVGEAHVAARSSSQRDHGEGNGGVMYPRCTLVGCAGGWALLLVAARER
jgi:phosphomannomutase